MSYYPHEYHKRTKGGKRVDTNNHGVTSSFRENDLNSFSENYEFSCLRTSIFMNNVNIQKEIYDCKGKKGERNPELLSYNLHNVQSSTTKKCLGEIDKLELI